MWNLAVMSGSGVLGQRVGPVAALIHNCFFYRINSRVTAQKIYQKQLIIDLFSLSSLQWIASPCPGRSRS